MLREESFNLVQHPDFINTPIGQVFRVDLPVCDKLAQGEPTVGWEGDNRLCIYVNNQTNCWELWRLESDLEYRKVATSPPGERLGEQSMNKLLKRLVEHDQRRGFDPYKATREASDKIHQEEDRKFTERLREDFIPKLKWAAKKDDI